MAPVLLYCFYLFASIASKLQRRHIAIRRDDDSGQVDFAYRVSAIIFVCSLSILFFQPFHLRQTPEQVVLLAILSGVSGAAAVSAQYIAQRHVEAGVTSLLGNAYAPVTILLSTIFLNEHLEPRQLAGTALLFVAAVMASQKHRLSRWRFDKYFWLNVFAGVSLAFTLASERALIKYNGFAGGTLVSWGAQAAMLGLAVLATQSKSQHDMKDTSITAGLRFAQQMSWVIFVTVLANLSVASATATFSTTATFIAGAIFLNEREDLKRKIFGSLIATAGLLLMI